MYVVLNGFSPFEAFAVALSFDVVDKISESPEGTILYENSEKLSFILVSL